MRTFKICFSSEHVILGGGTSYLINPENYNFVPEDGPLLSEQNKYLAIGIHKSVRYVEGYFLLNLLVKY
jgi:hypothetical protein